MKELLHNLAYKELHEVVKIQECQKLMALKGKAFNEQVLRHYMNQKKFDGFAPDTDDHDGFDPFLDNKPLAVQG